MLSSPQSPTAELLQRLTVLRIGLVFSVVLHHAWPPGTPQPDTAGALALQQLLAEGLTGVRMPLLFLAAGWLLCRDGPLSRAAWLQRGQRRLRSLLLPLLVWSLFAGGLMALLRQGPLGATLFHGGWPGWVPADGLLSLLDRLLGFGGPPWIYPLWFLRDLLLLCLAAPLLQALDRRAPWALWGLVLPVLAWRWWQGSEDPRPVSVDGAFFFALGVAGGLRGAGTRLLTWADRAGPWLLAPVLALGAWRALSPAGHFAPAWDRPWALAAMLLLLWLAGRQGGRAGWQQASRAAAPWAFWLFLTHEPLLSACRLVLRLLGLQAPLASGLVAALACTGLSLLAGAVLARAWPAALRVLSGGRLLRGPRTATPA